MADFLSDLLARSFEDHAKAVTLQPRLPSLFEPVHSQDRVPVPDPDLIGRETEMHTIEPPVTKIPRSWRSHPSTISAEVNLSSMGEERQPWVNSQEESLSERQITRSGTDPRIRAKNQETLFDQPNETFFPDKTPEYSPSLHGGDEALPVEPSSVPVQQTVGMTALKKPAQTPVEAIRLRDDGFVKDAIGFELENLTTGLNSASLLRPLLPDSLAEERQQFERQPESEQTRVVEIHIGRVEVRAMPAPVHHKTKPRPAAVMTLDEYLQRRKNGDHR